MTNSKLKNFRVESYEARVGRCYACCQENCRRCGCGCHTETETLYRLMRDDKVVASGFQSHLDEKGIASYVDRHLNVKAEKSKFAKARKDLRDKIKQLHKEEAAEIKRIKELRGW